MGPKQTTCVCGMVSGVPTKNTSHIQHIFFNPIVFMIIFRPRLWPHVLLYVHLQGNGSTCAPALHCTPAFLQGNCSMCAPALYCAVNCADINTAVMVTLLAAASPHHIALHEGTETCAEVVGLQRVRETWLSERACVVVCCVHRMLFVCRQRNQWCSDLR